MDHSIVAKIARDCLRVDRVDWPRAAVLTVAHDNDRSFLHDGRWYAPLIDTIEDDLRRKGTECVSAARIISRIKGDLAYGRVYSPEGAFARALVVKRVTGLFAGGRYPFSKMEEAAWSDILDRTGAKKVLAIQPSRELCTACRKRGIWVADVQHGVISASHPWYGAAFRAEDPLEWLPNAFLCWDEGGRQVIDQWGAGKGVDAIVTGNQWLARFARPSGDDSLVTNLLNTYCSTNPNPAGKPAILVAFSWGETNIPNGFMVDALRDVIRDTADKYHWSIRLHPNQINGFATNEGRRFHEFFNDQLQGFAECDLATRLPLPLILRHSDLTICWNSSVSIEGAQMGIRSALLDPRLRGGADLTGSYRHYSDAGLIHLVEDSKPTIAAWIDANLAGKSSEENYDVFNAAYDKVINSLAA